MIIRKLFKDDSYTLTCLGAIQCQEGRSCGGTGSYRVFWRLHETKMYICVRTWILLLVLYTLTPAAVARRGTEVVCRTSDNARF